VADVVRELAKQYPELLTRQCECGLAWAKSCGCVPGSCPWCDDTGRRLATLEELLEADKMMLWYENGWCAESEDESREVHCTATPGEAAARLLIELEAGRG
jgi:hypothetical protein